MPDFPRYQSKGQIDPRQTSLQAPEDTTAQMVDKTSQIVSNASEMAVKWSNAVDTIQKTTATANFKTGLLDITNRAQNDPDYNNSDQYFKEIEKLKTDNLKGFSSKAAEAQAALDFGYDSKVAQYQIENLYKKKMIDVGQASTLRLLDMEVASAAPNLEGRIRGVLAPQIQAGVISHEDAYKKEREYIRKGKYNSFLSDLNTDPSSTDAKLKKNEYEFDIDQLDKARSLYDSESKKIKAVTQDQLLTAYLNGDPVDVDDVKELMNTGKIDAGFAESMIKKLNDIPQPDVMSQDRTYIEFQDRFMDLQEKGNKAPLSEVVKLMSDAMKAHASGLLDKSDVQRILKDRSEVVQQKLEPVAEKIMEKRRPKTWLERLSFWSDEYSDAKPEIKARMYRKLLDGLAQGEDGDMLMSKIINDEIDVRLNDNLQKPDRVYGINPDTKERIYSEDGGGTWFSESTGKEVK